MPNEFDEYFAGFFFFSSILFSNSIHLRIEFSSQRSTECLNIWRAQSSAFQLLLLHYTIDVYQFTMCDTYTSPMTTYSEQFFFLLFFLFNFSLLIHCVYVCVCFFSVAQRRGIPTCRAANEIILHSRRILKRLIVDIKSLTAIKAMNNFSFCVSFFFLHIIGKCTVGEQQEPNEKKCEK